MTNHLNAPSRYLPSILGFLAMCVTIAVATTVHAQEDELPDLEPIMDGVAKIRGLEFKQSVTAEKQSLEDFKEYLIRDLEQAFPEDQFGDNQLQHRVTEKFESLVVLTRRTAVRQGAG